MGDQLEAEGLLYVSWGSFGLLLGYAACITLYLLRLVGVIRHMRSYNLCCSHGCAKQRDDTGAIVLISRSYAMYPSPVFR
jgi:hypothetical protein